MGFARRVGLQAAAVTTGLAGQRSYLLVKRFDCSQRDDPDPGNWSTRSASFLGTLNP